MDNESLRKHLLLAHEYSYLHDDWVHPLEEALDGVSAEEAIWRHGPDLKGIWDIVLHMAVWNENIIERIETGEKSSPKEGHWPSPPTTADEASWLAAKSRLRTSLDAVRLMLESTPLEKIESSAYGLADLLVRFSHNAYHIGQITKMREMTAGRPGT